MSQEFTDPKPLFSIEPDDGDMDGEEDEDEGEEIMTEETKGVTKTTATATIIEGEEEEEDDVDDEPTPTTLPIAPSPIKSEDKTSVIKKTYVYFIKCTKPINICIEPFKRSCWLPMTYSRKIS